MGVYKLPPKFYWDHRSRELPSGEVVKETSRHVHVRLTDEERDELLSDAEYYVSDGKYMSVEQGLISSARATVKRLRD